MNTRTSRAVAMSLLLVASLFVFGLPAGATSAPASVSTSSSLSVAPADPPTDQLGWENGYWYNESIAVNRTDGLNESELDAVVDRAMARVEHIRGLEFEVDVPVSIISRSEFRNQTAERSTGSTVARRLHQNVKLEALFFVGEGESATASQSDTLASSVLGYYSPSEQRIVIVSDNPDRLELDEITLAQELFHALQDQQFDLSQYDMSTRESHNAVDGIIEGDGNYVDYLYEQRCEATWDCLMPQSQSTSGGGSDRHVGILALMLQPYSDGPPFVAATREADGWSGVNDLYANPPESTEQTIHPEKYQSDSPTAVSVADRSSAAWRVPDLGSNSVDYAEFGEAGLYTMLWYPSYAETRANGARTDVVIPYDHFFSPTGGDLDLYNYDHPASAGWDGDRLVPYVTDRSAETGETGYVWKIAWDSDQDATEFASHYRELLAHHGAAAVSGVDDTYRIDSGAFADAFRVTVSGNYVTIVNAPTVDALPTVHSLTTDPSTDEGSDSNSMDVGDILTDDGPATALEAIAGDDGQVGLQDVLRAIEAFNEGTTVGGFEIGLQDVLEAISTYNQG